jgi:tetratricopeptide (TPR) repeat protein
VANIFVSFTRSDQQWAHWIAQELTALDHEPHVHDWEIGPGEDIVGWMERRHDQADYVLCVVSPDYLNEDKAPFSTWERRAALWRMVKGRKGHVLLFVVKSVRLPSLIDHFRRCDLVGLKELEARRRIAEFLREPAPPEKIVFPGEGGVAVSNVPIAVPEHFLGREDALAAVDAALKRHEGRVAVTAVHGLRGVGKTTLAAAYAERHRGQYRATWWVRAQTADSMRADLVSLGVRLGWVAADEKEAPAFEQVMERLRHEGEGLLIIYDNATQADALRPFLPKGGAARVLVTSNAPDWRGLAAPIELKLWPKGIGADYLIARTGRAAERAEAAALSEALGGLPLAHEQAAAYCERLSVSFADYVRRLAATPIKLLDAEKDAPLEYHDKLTVAKTFALAIEESAKLHPAAEPLIAHAALLAPEPIPLFLFSEGLEQLGEPLASDLSGDGLDEAVAALRAFALVDREAIADERDPSVTTETIRLHRLVRTVAAMRLQGEPAQEARRALISAVTSVYPQSDVLDEPAAWRLAQRLDALALDLVAGNVPVPAAAQAPASSLLDRLASYRQAAFGVHSEARLLFERALEFAEAAFGPRHINVAAILNNLGRVVHAQGHFGDAKQLFDRALSISMRERGPDHVETAACLENLAQLLVAQGDLTQAQLLFERTRAILEARLGPDHPDLAKTLSSLASVLNEKGDFELARSLNERALAISAYGDDHPNKAAILDNLGCNLMSLRDFTAARPVLERALKIREGTLGPGHLDTTTTLNNLGDLLRHIGDLSGAEQMLARAMSAREKSLGPKHPWTNVTRLNFARVRREQGSLIDSLRTSQAALTGLHKALGRQHDWTREAAWTVADTLDAIGRTGEAKVVRRKYSLPETAVSTAKGHTSS